MEAKAYLRQLHTQYNDNVRHSILEGEPTPISKNIELISRTALSIFVLDNAIKQHINKLKHSFPPEMSITALKRAGKFVIYCESQKEAMVKV